MFDLNTPKYKISIKQTTPVLSFEGDKKPKTCFIGVSWENPNFDVKYLPSIIKWVKTNFDFCSIIIADYLYRHSLMILRDLSETEATNLALSHGEQTFEEYKKVIPENSQFKIFRWLDKEVAVSQEYLQSFEKELRDNKIIMEDIDEDCQAYLQRKEQKINGSYHESIELCRKYIIEEMAFINHQAELGIHCSVYPGTQLNVLKNFSLNKYPECKLALKEVVYLDLKIKK